jgi:hypothetical protein
MNQLIIFFFIDFKKELQSTSVKFSHNNNGIAHILHRYWFLIFYNTIAI